MSQSKAEFLKSKIKPYQWILLSILSGILVMLPVLLWGVPNGADLTNHFRFTLPLFDEIAGGNYSPGWLDESNFGFGDPRFRFYPPFVYYLLCLFRFLTNDWYAATLLVFTLFSVIGALGVYFWTRNHLSQPIALMAAALFVLTPYHLAQFYQASLLAEFAATSLLPLAFLAVEKLLTKSNKDLSTPLGDIALLGASYSLIVTTHLPTAVIGSLSLGVFALLMTGWKENKKGLMFCAMGIFLGLLSSSWFWVKMVSELAWIQAGSGVSSAYYDYRNNFVFSPFAMDNINTFYGSMMTGLTIILLFPSIFIWKKILWEKEYPKALRVILILSFVSLLMTTELSRPVWVIVPKLKDVQFPYRWLTVASIMICPVAALSISIWKERIKQKNVRVFQWALLLFFAGGSAFTIYDVVIDTEYFSRGVFEQKISEARGGASFKDWLPRNAKELKDLSPMSEKITAGDRQISSIEWRSHRRTFSVAAGAETVAHVRSYYYPLWRGFAVNGEQKTSLEIFSADDGTLLVRIPNEAATIEVDFIEPPRTKISFIIALFGWLITFAFLIIGFICSRSRPIGTPNESTGENLADKIVR
jgi:hypothetical protein